MTDGSYPLGEEALRAEIDRLRAEVARMTLLLGEWPDDEAGDEPCEGRR